MGFYSRYIFPRLMNMGMSSENTSRYRQEVLKDAAGDVLEIGFGTGLNLPFYSPQVHKLYAVDVNEGMNALAKKNIGLTSIPVEYRFLNAKKLPFADHSFNTVVSTWTLCSILDVSQALHEIYRVLNPAGKFIFVEHGLSHEPTVQKWQHRLTPIQKVIADGCHLNRNIERLIQEAGFRFERLRKEYSPDTPKVGGYLYIGIARKNT